MSTLFLGGLTLALSQFIAGCMAKCAIYREIALSQMKASFPFVTEMLFDQDEVWHDAVQRAGRHLAQREVASSHGGDDAVQPGESGASAARAGIKRSAR